LKNEEVRLTLKSFGSSRAKRDKALFLLVMKSWFRISELFSLRIGDVWQADRLVERVTVAHWHMKQKTAGRAVLLHPEAKGYWPSGYLR
jgi:hypothetical protein